MHRTLFDDGGALHTRAFGEGHGEVDGVGAAVFFHIKARENVVGLGDGKQVAHLRRRDLVHVDAAMAVERRHASVFFESIFVRGDLDKAHAAKTRGLTGFGLKARVQIAGVFAHLG